MLPLHHSPSGEDEVLFYHKPQVRKAQVLRCAGSTRPSSPIRRPNRAFSASLGNSRTPGRVIFLFLHTESWPIIAVFRVIRLLYFVGLLQGPSLG